MTNVQKKEIVALIEAERERLGSAAAVGNKCGVSDTAISLMASGKYFTKGDDMWRKVAAALGWRPGGWRIAETTNYKAVFQVLQDAKRESLFIPISHKAGSGKSVTIDSYVSADTSKNVFKIKCREWSRRDFLINLCTVLGIQPGAAVRSPDALTNLVIDFFQLRQACPLLIIDEADKLKPAALRFVIPLFNECEDRLGVVIAGTENLKKEIKRGVAQSIKGYDEIDSRFGRNYISLLGATLADTRLICELNGVGEKDIQAAIFRECEPVRIQRDDRSVEVVEDLRRLKRVIQRHIIRLQEAA